MTDRSDVSAVLLTVGEATTDEALDSLRRQTLPPRETIVVRDVSPFHQAINRGARQVTAPFFVQVDADMILDPTCLAELRRAVGQNSGIVVGQLRDALIGRVVGIKLFRTEPFLAVMMGDTISPDTDLGNALRRSGWETVYTGRLSEGGGGGWRTYGEHRPDYRPEYTWRKYLLEGRRYRYRNNPDGLRWHFGRLEVSEHTSAVIALIALANGIFLASERDLLGPLGPDPQFVAVASFLDRNDKLGPAAALGPAADGPLGRIFSRYYEQGRDLFRSGGSDRFREILGTLRGCHQSDAALVATVGLCRGLLAPEGESGDDVADFHLLEKFLSAEPGGFGGVRGFAARLRRRLGGGRSE